MIQLAEAALARRQKYILQVYALLAFLSLAAFGSLHFFAEEDLITGSAELGGAAAIALTVFLLRITGNLAAARACLLSTMAVILFVLLLTGGTSGTGIFWFFMFPVAVFFLAGAREGLFWMLLMGVVISLTWFLGQAGMLTLYYSDIETRQLAVTLGVVTIGLFVYQRYREESENRALDSREKLQANISQTAALNVKMDKAKGEFVALASHQLRTPISAIKWSTEMLLNGDAGQLTEDQQDYIKGIEDSNKRLGNIVDAMLLVSSLDLGRIDVRTEVTDLAALSRKVLAEQQDKIPEKVLHITQDYESQLPKLRLDARIMSIILQNIFSNSIKYTPENGTIKVTIKRNDERLNLKSRGSISIEVADSGYGIPRDQQADVFGKMFRASNIKIKDTDGTGLGLYIVKALLDRVGGKVWFESEENKGATFHILLPVEGMSAPENSELRLS